MEELDLKELISMFLEKKLLIILVVSIFALMGAIYTLKFVTPIYQSTTSLVLAQIGGDNSEESNSITSSDIALNTNLIDNYRVIAKSKSVAQEVIDNLNLDTTVDIFTFGNQQGSIFFWFFSLFKDCFHFDILNPKELTVLHRKAK